MMARKIYAALDTNVLVSARLKPNSVPARLVAYALGGAIIPVTNELIFAEYSEVLHRPKFKLPARVISDLLDALRSVSLTVSAGNASAIQAHTPDADDIVFYATALTSRAAGNTTYLVTGNLRHFPQEDFIVSPRAMLDIIEQGNSR
ncbi:MAG: putative toxin-antitoxin system toxin component, PIN family [Ottowia sp.]|nr:putative toxin-antitoxin system toxin component, PIN family [Ottowia sp.]